MALGFEVGFILNFVKNNVFWREWDQMKIKDNNIPDPGFRKGQEQIPDFSGSHIYLSKVRKQRACAVLSSGQSILHILCVYLNRIMVNSQFPEPAGEQNNALNQENTNLLFPQCSRAHSHGFTACLHDSCGCLSRMLPCLWAGLGGRKPPHPRLTWTPALWQFSCRLSNAEMPANVIVSPLQWVMESTSRSFLFLSLPPLHK